MTTGGASARSSALTPDGRRVFQREVYASQYAPAPDLPFAVAFHIPAGATGGTLKVGDREPHCPGEGMTLSPKPVNSISGSRIKPSSDAASTVLQAPHLRARRF